MSRMPKIIVTAGSTRVYLDGIRFIATASRGSLARQIAYNAVNLGWDVTYMHGQGSLYPFRKDASPELLQKVKLVPVTTVDDLVEAMKKELLTGEYDAVIHAMAVSDFVPKEKREGKVPSSEKEWTIKLVPAPKVIKMIKEISPEIFLVGFKLELKVAREELIERARESQKKYKADIIVANDWSTVLQGNHKAIILNRQGEVISEEEKKENIASALIRIVGVYLKQKNN